MNRTKLFLLVLVVVVEWRKTNFVSECLCVVCRLCLCVQFTFRTWPLVRIAYLYLNNNFLLVFNNSHQFYSMIMFNRFISCIFFFLLFCLVFFDEFYELLLAFVARDCFLFFILFFLLLHQINSMWKEHALHWPSTSLLLSLEFCFAVRSLGFYFCVILFIDFVRARKITNKWLKRRNERMAYSCIK